MTPAAGPITAASTSSAGLLQLEVGFEGPQHHRLQVRGVDRQRLGRRVASSPGPRRCAGRRAPPAAPRPVLQASPLTTISRPRRMLVRRRRSARGSAATTGPGRSRAALTASRRARCRPPRPRRSGSRPGSSTWRRLLGVEGDGQGRAAGRRPSGWPVSPGTPLGQVDGDDLVAAPGHALRGVAPPRPSSGRDSPAPNRASIAEPRAPARRSAVSVVPVPARRRPPGRPAWQARRSCAPPPASRVPQDAGAPHSRRRRCCRARRAPAPAAGGSARRPRRPPPGPARSISSRPGVPAAIAAASARGHLGDG